MLKSSLRLVLAVLFLSLSSAWAQVQDYQRWSIPESARPNQETLEFYLNRYLTDPQRYAQIASPGNSQPREFKHSSRKEPRVQAAFESTALLSYILSERGEILVNDVNPRFAHMVNEETKFYSMSMGKSISAYVLGHAICANIVEGLDHRVSDWPVLQNTLYRNARIIDLINQRSGDQSVVNERRGLFKTGRNPNNASIKSLAERELADTAADQPYFNYNSVNPNIVLNYVIYRSNGQFEQLMKKIFHDKIRTERSVFFLKQLRGQESEGLARTTFYATRMDYLRIAQAMVDDWQANTCEGQFLKEVYARRQAKQGDQMQYSNPDGPFWAFRGYAGFFHTDYYNFKKDRNIISMDGYGGQMIVIDFDQARIVAVHAVHNNYNWKSLIADVIDTGKFKKHFWD